MKNSNHHYCLQCGSQLQLKTIENRPREQCPACGWIYYQHLKVGAGMLIEKDGKLLLLRRAGDPWQGTWNIPAGYVEFDEEPARAAEREVLEETGLRVRTTRLVSALFFDDDPRSNGIHLIYTGEILDGEAQVTAESTQVAYFSPDQIPADLCGAGHARAIHTWQEMKRHER